MGVRSRPMVWMTLRPHTHSPMQMPTPPYSNSQMGVGSFEVTLLLLYTSQRATKGPIALLFKKTKQKKHGGIRCYINKSVINLSKANRIRTSHRSHRGQRIQSRL